MKIGFFDSGLGGLTILKAVAKELPDFDYVFYGDTTNLPYGNKTEREIYELTKTGMEYLFEAGCGLVIVACNTASAETLRKLQTEFLPEQHIDKKILGVIAPTIEMLDFDQKTKVALLATKRTVESDKYALELKHKGNGNVELKQISAIDLVPLIEIGDLDLATEQAIKLIEAEGGECEVVVLGCTHYTEIKSQLRQHFKRQKNYLPRRNNSS